MYSDFRVESKKPSKLKWIDYNRSTADPPWIAQSSKLKAQNRKSNELSVVVPFNSNQTKQKDEKRLSVGSPPVASTFSSVQFVPQDPSPSAQIPSPAPPAPQDSPQPSPLRLSRSYEETPIFNLSQMQQAIPAPSPPVTESAFLDSNHPASPHGNQPSSPRGYPPSSQPVSFQPAYNFIPGSPSSTPPAAATIIPEPQARARNIARESIPHSDQYDMQQRILLQQQQQQHQQQRQQQHQHQQQQSSIPHDDLRSTYAGGYSPQIQTFEAHNYSPQQGIDQPVLPSPQPLNLRSRNDSNHLHQQATPPTMNMIKLEQTVQNVDPNVNITNVTPNVNQNVNQKSSTLPSTSSPVEANAQSTPTQQQLQQQQQLLLLQQHQQQQQQLQQMQQLQLLQQQQQQQQEQQRQQEELQQLQSRLPKEDFDSTGTFGTSSPEKAENRNNRIRSKSVPSPVRVRKGGIPVNIKVEDFIFEDDMEKASVNSRRKSVEDYPKRRTSVTIQEYIPKNNPNKRKASVTYTFDKLGDNLLKSQRRGSITFTNLGEKEDHEKTIEFLEDLDPQNPSELFAELLSNGITFDVIQKNAEFDELKDDLNFDTLLSDDVILEDELKFDEYFP